MSSDIELDIINFDVRFKVSLEADSTTGEIKPVFLGIHFDLGDSYLYHDNFFIMLLMHQIVFYAKVIFENSMFFFGLMLMNDMF